MDTSLLTTLEAAKYLGLSKAFLERDRWAGAKVTFGKFFNCHYRISIRSYWSLV
jgi:hypothetical protein